MPNYVTNNVELTGKQEDIEKLLKSIKSSDSDFDFEKIAPMPKELMGTQSKYGSSENELLKMIYGADDWYKWRLRFWGTKWNAGDVCLYGSRTITFKTAWATPETIFRKLSKDNPGVDIEVHFADEDMGSNCGILEFKSGQEVSWTDMSVSRVDEETAIRFALTVRYGSDDEYEDLMRQWEEEDEIEED